MQLKYTQAPGAHPAKHALTPLQKSLRFRGTYQWNQNPSPLNGMTRRVSLAGDAVLCNYAIHQAVRAYDVSIHEFNAHFHTADGELVGHMTGNIVDSRYNIPGSTIANVCHGYSSVLDERVYECGVAFADKLGLELKPEACDDEPFRLLFGRSGAVLDIAHIEMLATWADRHLGYVALAQLVTEHLTGGYQIGCCSLELPALMAGQAPADDFHLARAALLGGSRVGDGAGVVVQELGRRTRVWARSDAIALAGWEWAA